MSGAEDSTSKKTVAKKATTKKTTATKRATKRATTKKTASKKTTVKKTATKKTTATKRASTKKPATKKTTLKKTASDTVDEVVEGSEIASITDRNKNEESSEIASDSPAPERKAPTVVTGVQEERVTKQRPSTLSVLVSIVFIASWIGSAVIGYKYPGIIDVDAIIAQYNRDIQERIARGELDGAVTSPSRNTPRAIPSAVRREIVAEDTGDIATTTGEVSGTSTEAVSDTDSATSTEEVATSTPQLDEEEVADESFEIEVESFEEEIDE